MTTHSKTGRSLGLLGVADKPTTKSKTLPALLLRFHKLCCALQHSRCGWAYKCKNIYVDTYVGVYIGGHACFKEQHDIAGQVLAGKAAKQIIIEVGVAR